MTDQLALVIARLNALPAADQDRLAETILGMIETVTDALPLTAEQASIVRSRLNDLQEGSANVASEEDMADLWIQCGL